MKLSDLREAITPTGPAKIPTGGRGSILNPAHSPSAYYEGDPERFDFKAQKKNYEAVKTALARAGKKLSYIGVARSATGPDTFVATGPGVVWQKYVPADPQGSMNMIYINGIKIKLGDFLSSTPEEQDAILGGKKSDAILLLKKDVIEYVKTLVKETDKAGIEKSFATNQKAITRMVYNVVQYNPDILATVEECEKLLAAKGVVIPWFTKDAVIKKSISAILDHLAENLCYYKASVVQHTIDRFVQKGVNINIGMVLAKKDIIIKTMLRITRDNVGNISTMSVAHILEKILELKKLADWPELDVIKKSLVAYLIAEKESVIKILLKSIQDVINHNYDQQNVTNKVNILAQVLDWPELSIMKRSLSNM